MDKIEKAIIYLLQTDGTFYAEFFIQARRQEGKGILPEGTLMAVTVRNGRIFLLTDISRIEKFTVEQIAKGLQHEALHIVLEHAARRNGRHPLAWNYAGDLAINSMIPDMNIGLIPGQGEFKDWKKGLSAEEYYDKLEKEYEKQGGGEGEYEKQGGGEGEHKHEKCNCDAASRDIPDEFTREVYRKAVEEAVKVAQQRGHLPLDLEKAINEFVKPPKINWKVLLRQYVAAAVKANSLTTWRRENRKQLEIKGKMKDRILRLGLAIDTSGSIFGDPELLQEFYSEIVGIQKAYKSEIQIIECDAEIQKTYVLKTGRRPDAKFKGGGGTSFCPPYKWLIENKKRIDVLVYLTDLCGVFPDKEYYRTVWCVSKDGADEAPWGRLIKLG